MTLKEKEIYDDYYKFIENNMDICRKKAPEIKEYVTRSHLFYDNEIKSKSLMIPVIYSQETFDFLEEIMKTTQKICEKITQHYIDDPEYRSIFPFPKELEELIILDRGYDCLLPISRYDIFLNEETHDFYFCEFNTDGTSGMDENRIHDMSFIDNPAHQYIRSKYEIYPFELFDSLCHAFLDVYSTYYKAKDKPNIAIVDFEGAGRFTEFKHYARHFQALGCKCYVCDIRDLTYDGKTLHTDMGFEIDAIYRRSVTGDIIDRIDEIKPLIDAVKDKNVFLCGSFATTIAHNKWIFNAMHHEKTFEFLTDSEIEFCKKHVPGTVMFDDPALKEKVLKNKDSYILKTQDSYASLGVHAGVEYTEEEWVGIVNDCFDNNYLCQDFAPQYRTRNIDFAYGDGKWHEYLNMTGLYCFNGKLAGFFNRRSDGAIIRTYSNERVTPTYLIKE